MEFKNQEQIDLVKTIKLIWSKKKIILVSTGTWTILAIFYSLILDNIYKSSVTLLPQSKDTDVSKFSGLASLAGIDLNTVSTSNEAFYKDVITSDRILDKLIEKKWEFNGSEILIADFLEIDLDKGHPRPEDKRNFDTKKVLKERVISFETSSDNGLMTISVSVPREPELAALMANWLASEIHVFNENFRQKKNLETVESVKQQLETAKNDLEIAENELKRFRISNKSFLQSPELELEFARLQREVVTENTVYTELRKQFEIAKIDLEKSKETIIILDSAKVPVLKDRPRRSIIVIALTCLGGVLSVIYVILNSAIKTKW